MLFSTESRRVLSTLAVLLAAATVLAGCVRDPMPTEDLPGWRLVFSDDFERDELGDMWSSYDGEPGGDPYSHWDPSHVGLHGGKLVLRGYQEDGRWVTGGVSNYPVSQSYGRWEVRFRADASDEITYHFLLWPQDEGWPPEIDFAEDFGGNRESITAYVHYWGDEERQRVDRPLPEALERDFTEWQTVGVEWTEEEIRFLLDGQEWARVTADELGDGYPRDPMWLGLQAQAGGCQRQVDWGFEDNCPVAGTPEEADIEIDWVTVYAPE